MLWYTAPLARRGRAARMMSRLFGHAWKGFAGALFAVTLFCVPALAQAPSTVVRMAWLRLPGGTDYSAELASWAQEIRVRTSIDIAPAAVGVRPEDPAIFHYPLLYWGGDRAVPRLSDQAIAHLRQHLSTGGTLIVDNTGRIEPSHVFDQGMRRELERVFPQAVQRIASSHVLFRSFYRLDRPVGRRADAHDLEGIRVGSHMAVVYTRNDLSGALARAAMGGYASAVVPGGETQREQAFRLAVNLVMYALCLDYKDDHTHVMHLLRYRRGSRVPEPAGPQGGDEP